MVWYRYCWADLTVRLGAAGGQVGDGDLAARLVQAGRDGGCSGRLRLPRSALSSFWLLAHKLKYQEGINKSGCQFNKFTSANLLCLEIFFGISAEFLL